MIGTINFLRDRHALIAPSLTDVVIFFGLVAGMFVTGMLVFSYTAFRLLDLVGTLAIILFLFGAIQSVSYHLLAKVLGGQGPFRGIVRVCGRTQHLLLLSWATVAWLPPEFTGPGWLLALAVAMYWVYCHSMGIRTLYGISRCRTLIALLPSLIPVIYLWVFIGAMFQNIYPPLPMGRSPWMGLP